MELLTFLFVNSDEQQTNCLPLMKSCGTLGIMFHLKEIKNRSCSKIWMMPIHIIYNIDVYVCNLEIKLRWNELLVSLLWKHSCAFPLMVLFLRSIINDWQDDNKKTKKLCSHVWENLCSLYSNKCLRLASEKFVLASGSNLSLTTGLASWKFSLEPWKSCSLTTLENCPYVLSIPGLLPSFTATLVHPFV